MKTRMTGTLLLALTVVLALALFCLPAYAAGESAEPTATQTLTGDPGQVHFRVDDDGKVTILDDVSDSSLLLATYWKGPDFLGAEELKVGDVSAQTISGWTRVKLFWLDKQAKPVAPAPMVKARPGLAKTITSGIIRWSDLTDRHTRNYVADAFARNDAGMETTEFYLNGMRIQKEEVQNAAQYRGTVTEFYTDANGDIDIVKAYSYTADLVEGEVTTKTLSDGTVQVRIPGVISSYADADKVTGWEGLKEGDVVLYYKTIPDGGSLADASYTIEKAEKVTGKVSSFSTDGYLIINGSRYRGSEQSNAGSIGDVAFSASPHSPDYSDRVFGRWSESYNLTDEYDFYLDKNGSIVAGFLRSENTHRDKVCMVLATEVTDAGLGTPGALRAKLLFTDGSTEIVNVSKVATSSTGYKLKNVVDNVTNAERQILTSKAQEDIAGKKDAAVKQKFFNYRSTSTGYELTELNATQNARNWEDPVTLGDGTATVAAIQKSPVFAQAVGGTGSLTGWNITADSQTTFLVGKRNVNDNAVVYTVYKGFRSVPEMDAARITAICANTTADALAVNTVAKYVYLETKGAWEAPPDEPEGESRVGMVLEAEVSDGGLGMDGALRANLLFEDGTTEIVTVYKVDGLVVTDTVRLPDEQISIADAYERIAGKKDAATLTKFFRCAPTASGYVLAELNAAKAPDSWEDPASLGDGTAAVAAIRKSPAFAKAVGGADSLTGWSITADADTTFLVGERSDFDGTVAYRVCKGFQNVPEMDATRIAAICANTAADPAAVNTVAKYVYLETKVPGEAPPDEPEGESRVGMVLETEVSDAGLGTPGALRANLLFMDGTTEIVTVYKVDGLIVTDTVRRPDDQISTTDACARIAGRRDAAALTKFFRCAPTASGYVLAELNAANAPDSWEDPNSLGNGTARVTSIWKEATFAKALGATDSNQTLADWPITADLDTTFVVGKVNANTGAVAYYTYKGFRNVPEMDATRITAICANTSANVNDVNTVAQYVYLETGVFKAEPPEGYFFIPDNASTADPELIDDGVFLIHVVDPEGTATTMRVTSDLQDAISHESMILEQDYNRTYVGNFWAVGEIDEYGVVSSLTNGDVVNPANRPVALQKIVSMGNDVIAISNGNAIDYYAYDNYTKFIYVDMGWTDGQQSNNRIGVREEDMDEINFVEAGTFAPQGFFNINDVSDDPSAGVTYQSVKAAVICPANSDTADYVYVVRNLW